MNEKPNGLFGGHLQNSRQALDLVARLFDVADPGAVYAPPAVVGERTVIMASELTASLGVGYGGGADDGGEGGGGGGGGGFAAGRPVAAVIIEAGGVRIEPVVDVTKLGIALFTTLAAMFLAWGRMRREINKLKS